MLLGARCPKVTVHLARIRQSWAVSFLLALSLCPRSLCRSIRGVQLEVWSPGRVFDGPWLLGTLIDEDSAGGIGEDWTEVMHAGNYPVN